jgi:hypothetical protein
VRVSFLFLVVLQAATAQTATGTSNMRDLSARWAEYYAEVYRVPVDLVAAIIEGNYLMLVPSPKSPVPIRHLRYPQDADIVGRVVGFAHLIAPLHFEDRCYSLAQPEYCRTVRRSRLQRTVLLPSIC